MKKGVLLGGLAVFGVVALLVGVFVFNTVAANVAGPAIRAGFSSADHDRTEHPLPDWVAQFQDVQFTASDGVSLEGWWIPADGEGPHPAVVVSHGLGGHRRGMMDTIGQPLHDAGYSIIAFDQRNHGTSDDGPQSLITMGAAEALDILAAAKYIRDEASSLGADSDRIVLYGESMGGVATLHAARENPDGVVAVVSDSAFRGALFRASQDSGMPEFLVKPGLKSVGKELGVDLLAVDSTAAIQEIDDPVMVVHCTDDELTPVADFHAIVAERQDVATWSEPCPIQPQNTTKPMNHHVVAYLQDGYLPQLIEFLNDATA